LFYQNQSPYQGSTEPLVVPNLQLTEPLDSSETETPSNRSKRQSRAKRKLTLIQTEKDNHPSSDPSRHSELNYAETRMRTTSRRRKSLTLPKPVRQHTEKRSTDKRSPEKNPLKKNPLKKNPLKKNLMKKNRLKKNLLKKD